MPKSPEVLADRAHELARKLGYTSAVDRAAWIAPDRDYIAYAAAHSSGKNWKRTAADQVWPSAVAFWYRQSPQWMEPLTTDGGPPHVTETDPPYETSGMVTIRLDMTGNLLFLRAVPPQLELAGASREPDWNVLFAEAGLDRTRFRPASPKWSPPEAFDSRTDWEGSATDHPDIPLHVIVAAFHGIPVYFQVIAPWDQPWRSSAPSKAGADTDLPAAVLTATVVGVFFAGLLFARWNLRQGRGDSKGALRLAAFYWIPSCVLGVASYHLAPRPDYILVQLIMLGIPLFVAFVVAVMYVAAEPFARRSWPRLMVSWQRLLSGRWHDPLVGRDIVFGVLAGAIVATILMAISRFYEVLEVFPDFGQGTWASLGKSLTLLSWAAANAMQWLAVLTIATGIFRKKWLGVVMTGLVIVAENAAPSAVDVTLTVVLASVLMAVLLRFGLIAGASFFAVFLTLVASPPLNFSEWYSGRAMIALLVPTGLLIYGFWISLGGQSPFGNALAEEKMR